MNSDSKTPERKKLRLVDCTTGKLNYTLFKLIQITLIFFEISGLISRT